MVWAGDRGDPVPDPILRGGVLAAVLALRAHDRPSHVSSSAAVRDRKTRASSGDQSVTPSCAHAHRLLDTEKWRLL